MLVALVAACQADEDGAVVLKGGGLRVLLPGIPDGSSYATYDIVGEAAAAAMGEAPKKFVYRGIPTQFQSPPVSEFAPGGGDDKEVLRAYLDWEANYFRSQGAQVSVSKPKFEKSGKLTKMKGLITVTLQDRSIIFCIEALRAGNHVASFICQLNNPSEERTARDLQCKLAGSFKIVPRPFTDDELIQMSKEQQQGE